METTFEQKIFHIFGTNDPVELQKIADEYHKMKKEEQERIPAGRKNTFSDQQIATILALKDQGENISDIAKKYQVTRQTIYNQIRRYRQFSNNPDEKMRMNFMNRNELCTTIDIDFKHEKIHIQNYTEQIPLRAFGVVTEPSWEDFEYFLEERCFPKTRDHAKEILKEIGVPFYDPLLIIEKTKGYMAGDHQWIMIIKKEEKT